jgi:spermidine/putrescine transport system permease protein
VFLVYSFWVTATTSSSPTGRFRTTSTSSTDGTYRALFRKTLEIALISAAITTLIAYTFAHAIRFHLGRFQEFLLFLVMVALFSGYLVRIYAWRTILGDEGIINSALRRIGLIDQPLSFLLYSRTAAIIVFVNFLAPLAVLPIYAALQNVRQDEVEAARDLGAGPFAAFRRVTLPLALERRLRRLRAHLHHLRRRLLDAPARRRHERLDDRPRGRRRFRDYVRVAVGSALSFLTLAFTLALLAVFRLVSARIVR